MHSQPPSRAQRGSANVKFVFVLVVIGIIGYLCFKLAPPYVNNYQLQDTLDTESRFFAARTKKEDMVRKDVWGQIQSLDIPARQEDIKVEIIGHTARISVAYTVVVELPGYTAKLDFHPKGESPVF
jgi:hypothetical protein